MPQYKALHTIVRGKSAGEARTANNPGKPPEVETIKPGTIIGHIQGEEAKTLLAAGAIVEDHGDQKSGALAYDDSIETTGGEGPTPKRGRKGAVDKSPAGRRAARSGDTQAVPATMGAAAKAKEEGLPDGTEKKDRAADEDLV
jgi:hypothetical protein